MTYQRKPEHEIQRIKEQQKRQGLSLMPSLWLALGSALLIFLFVSHFPARFSPPLGFTSKSFGVALASGLGIFIFLYGMQMITRHITSGEPRAEICAVCFKAALPEAKRCPCGGEYEPLEYYEESDE